MQEKWTGPVYQLKPLSTFALAYALPNAYPINARSTHLIGGSDVQPNLYKYMFFFGNSYTNIAFDPEGQQPSPSNPLGNNATKSCGNVDLTGGPNWATDLTIRLNSSTLLTYDFAFNCATVDKAIVDVSYPGGPCTCTEGHYVVDQVSQFKKILTKGSAYGNFTEKDSLFAVWIGINDAHTSYDKPDLDALMGKVVVRYFEQLDALYELGARKFLLLGVPPYDRTPNVIAEAAANATVGKLEKSAYVALNDHLFKTYNDTWRMAHENVTSVLVDTIPIFNDILDNPGLVGLPNSSATCVGSECLWNDGFHPGVKLHSYLADRIVAQVGGIFPEFLQGQRRRRRQVKLGDL